jgi:hypothetical protein
MPDWFWTALEQLWSFLAVALAVNRLGNVSKRIAEARGWRRVSTSALVKAAASTEALPPPEPTWYDLTVRVHPLFAGALFGLLPLPTLNVIDALEPGAIHAARCAWFMLAGALSGQVYGAIKFAFLMGRKRLAALASAPPPSEERGSDPPDEAS